MTHSSLNPFYRADRQDDNLCHINLQNEQNLLGQKYYPCKMCGKMLSTKSGLHNHLKSHEPPKFTCSVCCQKFTHKHHLVRHLKLVHSLTKCFHCLKTYPSTDSHICRT